jgi:hypothetical protein
VPKGWPLAALQLGEAEKCGGILGVVLPGMHVASLEPQQPRSARSVQEQFPVDEVATFQALLAERFELVAERRGEAIVDLGLTYRIYKRRV